jgi:hypothetical protein
VPSIAQLSVAEIRNLEDFNGTVFWETDLSIPRLAFLRHMLIGVNSLPNILAKPTQVRDAMRAAILAARVACQRSGKLLLLIVRQLGLSAI